MNDYFKSSNYFDQRLIESEHFYAIPSLGSIVPGWLLIIPKKACLNMSELEELELEELDHFLNSLRSILAPIYGENFVQFEHGPSKIGSPTGCSVDFAHMHLVPSGHDVLSKSFELLDSEWTEVNSILNLKDSIQDQNDYLFLMDQRNRCFITQDQEFESQFFRRIIASFEGKPAMYNWREYPFKENILETVESVGSTINYGKTG